MPPSTRTGMGATPYPGGVTFRVWAPHAPDVLVAGDFNGWSETSTPLAPEGNGHWSVDVPGAAAGQRYKFKVGGRLRIDPRAALVTNSVGDGIIVSPDFAWRVNDFRMPPWNELVIYEMHVGTFTAEGTWRAAAAGLDELARIGITVIEMMPIAEFPGRFGWGYDGVDLYAPAHVYGAPDDLRAFVDRAHALGLGVILDVVYNHLGPDGNYLNDFSQDYFTGKYTNDWGQAVNFEGLEPVRQLFVQNAAYWIDEFHFDGLRLDATQDIKDASPRHVMADIIASARQATGSRPIYIVAENEPQQTIIVRPPDEGGYGADALWNDDAHHAAMVALLGRREAYYSDYLGTAEELVSSARFGYLYQGQWYSWQEQPRGTPALDLLPRAFLTYLENHDQVANSAWGRRLHQLS